MDTPFPLIFPNGQHVPAVEVAALSDLHSALQTLGVPLGMPVLTLVGGAGGLGPSHWQQLQNFFAQVIAPLIQQQGWAAVDGGTHSGVMALMGEVRQAMANPCPLIGVAARGTVHLPMEPLDDREERSPLDPHHSGFILVPGHTWGDESRWLAQTGVTLAQGQPVITLMINGGGITFQDAAMSVQVHSPVIAVEGSGRAADLVAAALRGEGTDERAIALVESGLVHSIALHDAAIVNQNKILQIMDSALDKSLETPLKTTLD